MNGRSSGIINDLKFQYHHGGIVARLVFANVGVWSVLLLSRIIFGTLANSPDTYGFIRNAFVMPSNLLELLFHAWTPFTYMFAHEGFFHILFNMLWLWWFGRIFVSFLSEKKILPIYLLGGLVGGFIYAFLYNILPLLDGVNSTLIGASASVMAIIFATVALVPDYSVRMVFLGDVRIKYIAIFAIIMDLVSIAEINNIGGSFAHLGGAATGFILIRLLQNGYNLLAPFEQFFEAIANWGQPPRMRATYKNTQHNRPIYAKKEAPKKEQNKAPASYFSSEMNADQKQELVDELLDKIKAKGYNSLSKEEQSFLFTFSKEK